MYFLLILIIVFSTYLGVLVYKNDPQKKDNRLFLWLVLWMNLWLIANYLQNEIIFGSFRSIFLYLDFTIAPILGYFLFLFCYNFLENKKINRFLNFLLIIIIFFLIFSVVKNFVFIDVDVSGKLISFSNGLLFPVYAVFIISMMVGGSVLLIFKYFRFTKYKKNQVLFVMIGFLLASLCGTTINLFFQDTLSLEFFRLGALSSFFLVFFTAYAIIRHKLFDIKVVIQRSVIYGTLLIIIVCSYLFLVFLFGLFFEHSNHINTLGAGIFITVLGIFGVPVLRSYFIKWTDKIFFKDKYDYQKSVLALGEIINKNINLDNLLIKLCSSLREILKVSLVTITLPDEKITYDSKGLFKIEYQDLIEGIIKIVGNKQEVIFRKDDFKLIIEKEHTGKLKQKKIVLMKKYQKIANRYGLEIFVAVFAENRLIGLISLSKKMSNDDFDRTDINLLKTISVQAGVAIEKAKLYQRVKEYSIDLEEKVKQRTAKIVGLQESQKQMMQEMAHGLQTPLTILKGELTGLKEKLKDNKKISLIERSIDRVSDFIYDMLRLSKMEAEGKNFKKEKFSLSELMLDLIESFEIITSEKGIKIKHTISPSVNFIGDKRAIEELISNLVSNSVKYLRDDNEKIIKIKLSKTNKKIKISIADNGIGIAKEDIPKLFSRFYRIKSNLKSKQGSGLGLVICKAIVKKHNGNIEIKSEINQGTEIVIRFE